MKFDKALWDGSDPSYAPLASWSGKTMWWKATPKYVRLGYEPKRVKLSGEKGDGRDLERAAEAREQTRAMVEAFEKPTIARGSCAWLIHRYRTDEFSPFHDVKANTRGGYEWQLERWVKIIGHMQAGAVSFEELKRIQNAMITAGRSTSYIKRMFTTLRIFGRYGVAVKEPGAADLVSVLAQMRFKAPPKRQIAPTREEILAIVDEADRRGMYAFATGLMLQWVLALRGVDVFGHWLPDPKGEGGIRRGDEIWRDGLTWDMLTPDLMAFEKVISKTATALPEPTRFTLENAPKLRERLRRLGERGRVGPVIVREDDGLPYSLNGRTQAFLRLRRSLIRAGAPIRPEITMMDTRAGALTHGHQKGADLTTLRDGAGHLDASTTNRYLRSREANIAKLAHIRGDG